jgi:hypothetical protein
MNSFPFHVSEWIAPAHLAVVVTTISLPPAAARIVASPFGGTGSAQTMAMSTKPQMANVANRSG